MNIYSCFMMNLKLFVDAIFKPQFSQMKLITLARSGPHIFQKKYDKLLNLNFTIHFEFNNQRLN